MPFDRLWILPMLFITNLLRRLRPQVLDYYRTNWNGHHIISICSSGLHKSGIFTQCSFGSTMTSKTPLINRDNQNINENFLPTTNKNSNILLSENKKLLYLKFVKYIHVYTINVSLSISNVSIAVLKLLCTVWRESNRWSYVPELDAMPPSNAAIGAFINYSLQISGGGQFWKRSSGFWDHLSVLHRPWYSAHCGTHLWKNFRSFRLFNRSLLLLELLCRSL
jgi:hypothetical protein